MSGYKERKFHRVIILILVAILIFTFLQHFYTQSPEWHQSQTRINKNTFVVCGWVPVVISGDRLKVSNRCGRDNRIRKYSYQFNPATCAPILLYYIENEWASSYVCMYIYIESKFGNADARERRFMNWIDEFRRRTMSRCWLTQIENHWKNPIFIFQINNNKK